MLHAGCPDVPRRLRVSGLTILDDRSISWPVKKNARQNILEAAAPLIHSQGFHRTGLKEILDAAGVPKGSFYFYFKSKEDFGLALIDHYADSMGALAASILAEDGSPALERLSRFFTVLCGRMAERGCANGCPIGNLAQEVSDLSPGMRARLSQVMEGFTRRVESVLASAAEAGELPGGLDPARTAGFVVDAWEGAILRSKADKDPAPLDRFQDIVFNRLLR